MCRKIAGDCDENVPALVGVAPDRELPDSRLQDLIGMEACVFAEQHMRERGDERLRRMAEVEMPRHQPCHNINLSLPVEGVEQDRAYRVSISGQVVDLLAVLARDAGRR